LNFRQLSASNLYFRQNELPKRRGTAAWRGAEFTNYEDVRQIIGSISGNLMGQVT